MLFKQYDFQSFFFCMINTNSIKILILSLKNLLGSEIVECSPPNIDMAAIVQQEFARKLVSFENCTDHKTIVPKNSPAD